MPASSANLGPGYDVLAAALQMHLELEVTEAGEFAVSAPGLDVPTGRDNLIVRSFERLHSADGLRFEIRSEIPLAAGLGSSAAAIVAGLYAADHMYELGRTPEELFALASEIEGHPDNVAAAIWGGVVVCPPAADAAATDGSLDPVQIATQPDAATLLGGPPAPLRLEPPQGVEALLVIPAEEVPTVKAREAIPADVPLVEATANAAATAHLALGIERSDLTLIRRGLADRLHQPRREPLYPRSMELVRDAERFGAIGATISGAGPTVLVWSYWQTSGKVAEALRERVEGWAEVRRCPFTPMGADVPEL